MDQGLIKVTNNATKSTWFSCWSKNMEHNENAQLASVNLLEAMYYFITTGDSAKPETIAFSGMLVLQAKVMLRPRIYRSMPCECIENNQIFCLNFDCCILRMWCPFC